MNEAEWRQTYGVSGSEKLPLVTIVAINWNYSAYLKTAMESAVAQDYPALEIVFLDNGSEDNSVTLIDAFVEQHPEARFIRLAQNIGQLGAAHHILTQHTIGGDYVAFIDTDDFFFPNFISHHIRAHLLIGNGAGVSTSDALQIDQHGTIMAGNLSGWWKADNAERAGWADVTITTHHALPETLALTIIPSNQGGWCWYPGTSIVYRRQSIDRLMSAIGGPVEIKFALDSSAAPFCHEDGGSIMLSEPLSCYRIHGSNASVTAQRLQYLDARRASFETSNKRQEQWLHEALRAKQPADTIKG